MVRNGYQRLILRVLLLLEIVSFGYVYIAGPDGLRAIKAMDRENSAIERAIAAEKSEIELLEQKIAAWQEDPFYKEQIARERLSMARADELVYLTPSI